jgi:DNA-binding beta-propeller fold protein YncE
MLCAAALLLVAPRDAAAQCPVASTFVGPNEVSLLVSPIGVVLDANDNSTDTLLVADNFANAIVRYDRLSRAASVWVGSAAGDGGSQDGAGTSARFRAMRDMKQNPATGDTFVVASADGCIRRVTRAGVVSSIGRCGTPGFADGPASSAMMESPYSLSVSAARQTLFFTEDSGGAGAGKNSIRAVNLVDMTVSTVAGASFSTFAGGIMPASLCGVAFSATRGGPGGSIFASDCDLCVIFRFDVSARTAEVVAGSVCGGNTSAAQGTSAQFHFPSAVALSPDEGLLYVSDLQNSVVREINLTTMSVTLLAGGAPACAGGAPVCNGQGDSARILAPRFITVMPNGDMFVTTLGLPYLYSITRQGQALVVLPEATAGPIQPVLAREGTGLSASFDTIGSMEFDPEDNLIVADSAAHVLMLATRAAS